MPGGLTLRRRGFRLAAQIESGLNRQTGRKNRIYDAGWPKSTQLSTDFPNFNFDPGAPSRGGNVHQPAGCIRPEKSIS